MIMLAFATLFLLSGMFVLGVATVGIYRFSSVLPRIHVAAKCDTLGVLLSLTGLLFLLPSPAVAGKLVAILFFLWCTAPVVSHRIARAEVEICPHLTGEVPTLSCTALHSEAVCALDDLSASCRGQEKNINARH